MRTPQEIIQLRDELKKLQAQAKKSRSRGIFGFGLLIFVIILSAGYGFVQQAQAEKILEESLKQKKLLGNTLAWGDKNAKEAELQRTIADEQRMASEKFAGEARYLHAELEKCRRSRNR